MDLGTREGFARPEPQHVRAANDQLVADLLDPITNNSWEVGRSACGGASGKHQQLGVHKQLSSDQGKPVRLSCEKKRTDCETEGIDNACEDRTRQAGCSPVKLAGTRADSRHALFNRKSRRRRPRKQRVIAGRNRLPNAIHERH
jgi:hypothetical protein